MCDPVTISAAATTIATTFSAATAAVTPGTLLAASAGFSALTGGMQYIAGRQNADATDRYNKQLQENAAAAYAGETRQGQTQAFYQDIKSGNAINAADLNARAGAATAVNSAGDAGVGGNTVAELARDYYNRAGRQEGDIIEQRDASQNQIEQQIVGAGYQYQDRLNQRKVVTEPGLLPAAIQVGGAVVGSKYAPQVFGFPAAANTSGNQGENVGSG